MCARSTSVRREAPGAGAGSLTAPAAQAPTKALCSERFDDWTRRFGALGYRCTELTGDSDSTALAQLSSANIMCVRARARPPGRLTWRRRSLTTPEKWDRCAAVLRAARRRPPARLTRARARLRSVTRKWRDRHRLIVEQVRLVLVDEIHLLHEDRGATLEAVVTRMRMQSAGARATPVRYARTLARSRAARRSRDAGSVVAVSATFPNIGDVAAWLGCSARGLCTFDESVRPVPVDVHVLGYAGNANAFVFDRYSRALRSRARERVLACARAHALVCAAHAGR